MHHQNRHVMLRDDTLLGVCEALGEDFGFNPLPLRIMLAVPLIWQPAAVIGLYLSLAAIVAVTRWLVPDPRSRTAPAAPAVAEPQDDAELPLAA